MLVAESTVVKMLLIEVVTPVKTSVRPVPIPPKERADPYKLNIREII